MLVRLIRPPANRMNRVLRQFIGTEISTAPSNIPSAFSPRENGDPSTPIELRFSADLIEQDFIGEFLDTGNGRDLKLGRKMRDLCWLHSYIDGIEGLVLVG
ncbi:hypothetical protein F5Y11DRAFT_367382 [Daldinia sp. FL1419]|nr:hypothetical protein F5Y11DRAFT_367382 [Daldinia sp. FL1419]